MHTRRLWNVRHKKFHLICQTAVVAQNKVFPQIGQKGGFNKLHNGLLECLDGLMNGAGKSINFEHCALSNTKIKWILLALVVTELANCQVRRTLADANTVSRKHRLVFVCITHARFCLS